MQPRPLEVTPEKKLLANNSHTHILGLIKANINFVSTFTAGTACAVATHPIDRALFMAMGQDKPLPLFRLENFRHPFQGFYQVFGYRIISAGAYPFFQSIAHQHLKPILGQHIKGQALPTFVTGLAAGSSYGVLTTIMSNIKSQTWKTSNGTFISSLRAMAKQGGFKPFFKGLAPTMLRDSVFGVVNEETYTLLSYAVNIKDQEQNDFKKFSCKVTSAGFAAVCSGIPNYVKVKQQASHPSAASPKIPQILKCLFWEESTGQLRKLSEISLSLRIGSGTARVALGMAGTMMLSDYIKDYLNHSESGQQTIGLRK